MNLKVKETETSTMIPVTSHQYNATMDFYTIILQNNLVAGKEYQIYIEFVAPISTNRLDGLYRAQFTLPGSTEIKLV